MLFNSIDFAIYLPIVFIIYWFIGKNLKSQNLIILIASYVFYGWWDWRFLSLILFSTTLDYFIGLRLQREENHKKRRILLWLSVLVNIGILVFFKYYNFFIENFIATFSFFGFHFSTGSLNIILPVGISFYTFQTLSYSIDLYNRKLDYSKDFISFAAFVSFFPQLVAGPIERASNLLHQFNCKRSFDRFEAVDGLRQILWGLFKKVVVADNCAMYANEIFDNYEEQSGSVLLLGAIYFAFQIYGDFSGYSDIAIGTAKLFNITLMKNFSMPYFSRDIAEFWRRWHISLSTWFRDYVYIPLGGSRVGKGKQIRNTFIIFIVSGFWHGANWTFIIWGALNAIYFLPLLLTKNNRNHIDNVANNRLLPNLTETAQILFTFFLTVIAWIFFRSNTVIDAIYYNYFMLSYSLFSMPTSYRFNLIYIILLIIIEWTTRDIEHPFKFNNEKFPKLFRWAVYLIFIYMVLLFGGDPQTFIYFQF